jgi:hypothetical protein
MKQIKPAKQYMNLLTIFEIHIATSQLIVFTKEYLVSQKTIIKSAKNMLRALCIRDDLLLFVDLILYRWSHSTKLDGAKIGSNSLQLK